MVNHERRVYEPSDEVRVYDASEEEEDVEGSRLPLLIVLALVVLAMFAGVVYLAYTQGVARGRGETPVLAAADGPARIAPQQPGGAQVPYQGFKIYEQPAPPDDAVDDAPAQTGGAGQSASKQSAPSQTAQAETPAPKEVPKPAPALPPQAVAKPAPQQSPQQAVSKPAPAKPASAPTGVATAAPRALAPAAQPATGGSYFLQIGAFKSQEDAQTAWKNFQGRHATLIAGHGLDVQRVDLGDKGVWYRARVGGFADRDVALAMCDRLKADGGNCFLAR